MKILKFYNSKITSDIKNINKVVDAIISYLKCFCHITEECFIFDSKVILNELIVNAIIHGNKQDCKKIVKIKAALINDKYLLIQIEDEGAGYNYRCDLNNTGVLLNTEDCCLLENGRGIQIVKCLCDRVKYNSKGNKVVVFKKLIND